MQKQRKGKICEGSAGEGTTKAHSAQCRKHKTYLTITQSHKPDLTGWPARNPFLYARFNFTDRLLFPLSNNRYRDDFVIALNFLSKLGATHGKCGEYDASFATTLTDRKKSRKAGKRARVRNEKPLISSALISIIILKNEFYWWGEKASREEINCCWKVGLSRIICVDSG